MDNNETYRLYLRDLVYLLKERQSELKLEDEKDEFTNGIEFSYNAVIDLIESQAESFQIETSDFGFNEFEKFNNKVN